MTPSSPIQNDPTSVPTSRRRVLVVTGSRAEYGLLVPVMHAIRAHPGLELLLGVTGSHLVASMGMTRQQIVRDGWTIDAQVDMHITGDDPASLCAAAGRCTEGFGRELTRLAPDLLLVLGDRYEILAVALAGTIARVPIAHIAGGDITEGAFDDALRHAITKLSHVHFVTSDAARARVIQMGEDPASVHAVGSPGIDAIRTLEPVPAPELSRELGLPTGRPLLLVTYHPETLDSVPATDRCRELLGALEAFVSDMSVVLVGANADPQGQAINTEMTRWAQGRPGVVFVPSMDHQRYLSLMRMSRAVVGNSSSGLYEAPALRVPSVNIGARQGGRLRAASVLDVPCERGAIAGAIRSALVMDCSGVKSPYGDGHAGERIARVLGGLSDPRALLRKRFVPVR